ncbi:MAG: Adenosine monophosphate-protein transferase SoFic [candidate division WS6 bacterium OLB20]|uniref:Adenosine monophosphate-protein transferase SoFic n=1 Tax=candidate division WS6 bacterium OLB20 TaxID=1617426 RepID=A0A136LYK5_9BACT|nr:MAG: Adenosine monophosphate-protein transferase SoFic [candidate division WS6 bacterium OLB20]
MAFQPRYTITDFILNHVAQAEAARQIITNAPLVPSWERQFQHTALVRTVHHSVAIEGNALSLSETERIIGGEELQTIRQRDVKEIVNYRNAISYIDDKRDVALSIPFLLELHRIMGDQVLEHEKTGVFRANDAVIVSSKTGAVVFDPPGPDEIEAEVEDLCLWDNTVATRVHPLLRAGILHYELVRIHPFVDLNGRTSRLLATWSLYRDQYDIRRFFSLEEYYDQNSSSYYEALESAHEGDMTWWLEYFVAGVSVELGRIKARVLELSRDQKLLQKLGQVALNDRQMQIVQYLEENEEIRNQDFAVQFPDVSDDTILRDLKDLIDKKIVVKKGRTKAARYLLA